MRGVYRIRSWVHRQDGLTKSKTGRRQMPHGSWCVPWTLTSSAVPECRHPGPSTARVPKTARSLMPAEFLVRRHSYRSRWQNFVSRRLRQRAAEVRWVAEALCERHRRHCSRTWSCDVLRRHFHHPFGRRMEERGANSIPCTVLD